MEFQGSILRVPMVYTVDLLVFLSSATTNYANDIAVLVIHNNHTEVSL